MSSTELINQQDLSETLITQIKPILKGPQQKNKLFTPRLDWAGNVIIKGGVHRIAFANQNGTPRSFMDILSNDPMNFGEELEEDYNRMSLQVTQKKKKIQPELSEKSVCCCMF